MALILFCVSFILIGVARILINVVRVLIIKVWLYNNSVLSTFGKE